MPSSGQAAGPRHVHLQARLLFLAGAEQNQPGPLREGLLSHTSPRKKGTFHDVLEMLASVTLSHLFLHRSWVRLSPEPEREPPEGEHCMSIIF